VSWLLPFVLAAIVLQGLALERQLLVFIASALAIVPLAGWMGGATEQIAARRGRGRHGTAERGTGARTKQ
jgi:Ca2+:H+ antiporter